MCGKCMLPHVVIGFDPLLVNFLYNFLCQSVCTPPFFCVILNIFYFICLFVRLRKHKSQVKSKCFARFFFFFLPSKVESHFYRPVWHGSYASNLKNVCHLHVVIVNICSLSWSTTTTTTTKKNVTNC